MRAFGLLADQVGPACPFIFTWRVLVFREGACCDLELEKAEALSNQAGYACSSNSCSALIKERFGEYLDIVA